jgi:EAL domain-containing protein (putative c-di-GMP-specific phosphodiesterase class I)
VDLGRWVLSEACRQSRAWQLLTGTPVPISVNLSPRQIEHSDFVADVAAALDQTGLSAEHLTLEITESVLMGDTEAAISTLTAIKRLGVRLAIDDFGTGYSSLSYLRRFPVDVIKIDRSFVATLDTGATEAALVRSIIALGDALGLETVAEGVEDAAQLRELIELGARYGQGFHFSRPLTVAAMTEQLVERSTLASATAGRPPKSSIQASLVAFGRH